jgi:predicted nucleotidyltransferase component of viral defense system
MNLFDQLVTRAIQHQPDLSSLRVVVEKELLHHDILRILHDEGLLQNLSFIGGTCLRACYGSHRLSEDLDFTGGHEFSRDNLSSMGKILVAKLQHKYGLHVSVDEPMKDKKNVDTWKLKIQTRPDSKHLPAQRIHIDICLVPSYEIRPMMLINPYGVEMGTSNLVLSAQSREEINVWDFILYLLKEARNHDLY